MKLELLKAIIASLESLGATNDTNVLLYNTLETEKAARSPDREPFMNTEISEEVILTPSQYRVHAGDKEGTFYLPLMVSRTEHPEFENWRTAN